MTRKPYLEINEDVVSKNILYKSIKLLYKHIVIIQISNDTYKAPVPPLTNNCLQAQERINQLINLINSGANIRYPHYNINKTVFGHVSQF